MIAFCRLGSLAGDNFFVCFKSNFLTETKKLKLLEVFRFVNTIIIHRVTDGMQLPRLLTTPYRGGRYIQHIYNFSDLVEIFHTTMRKV
jgi:hypothetical protein